MATVKPKRKTSVVSAYGSAPKGVSGASKPVGFTGATKPATAGVTQPPRPAAPALAAVPKIAVGPPPPSVQTTSDRNSTNYSYGTMLGDTNSQIRSLAAQFGGAPQVTQYGFDPTKGYGGADTETKLDVAPNQPGSTMEVLLRNLGLTKGNINDTNEADNTFFSSRRLGQLGAADTQFTGDAAAAKRQYDDAMGALVTAILQGRGTRNQNWAQADITDAQAAAATPPEAQAVNPAATPGYLNPQGQFVSGGISSPGTTSLINQWISQSKKPKKK